jgi:hypothetical protein
VVRTKEIARSFPLREEGALRSWLPTESLPCAGDHRFAAVKIRGIGNHPEKPGTIPLFKMQSHALKNELNAPC